MPCFQAGFGRKRRYSRFARRNRLLEARHCTSCIKSIRACVTRREVSKFDYRNLRERILLPRGRGIALHQRLQQTPVVSSSFQLGGARERALWIKPSTELIWPQQASDAHHPANPGISVAIRAKVKRDRSPSPQRKFS